MMPIQNCDKMDKLECKVISKFLDSFSGSTYYNYKSQIINFFDFLNVDPDEYIVDTRFLENGQRIKQHDIYESDIRKYHNHLKKDKAPRTIRAIINTIRIFFKRTRITIDDVFWDELRAEGSGNEVLTQDVAPTKKELRKILEHGNVLERAYILAFSSSGIRPKALCKVILDDVYLDETPARIHVRPIKAKTKHGRDAYISNEAVQSIKEWLKIRKDWLNTTSNRCNMYYRHKVDGKWQFDTKDGKRIKVTKDKNDDRLFPFEVTAIRYRYNRILERAGLIKKDKYTDTYILHFYTLKKYFRTNFGDPDKAEALMGHINFYRRFNPEELKKSYVENVRNLEVYGEYNVDLEKRFDLKLKEKDKQIQDLDKQLKDLRMELLEVKMKQVQELQRKRK